jgi:hypothetical protein
VTQTKKQSEPKPYINKHLVIPIFFNESSADLEGWCEGAPGVGRVIGVKSVLYSDGSAKRWYRMGTAKKKLNQKKNSRERVSKK